MHWQRRLLILFACLAAAGVLAFNWRVIRATQGPQTPVAAAAPTVKPIDAPEVTFVDPSIGPKDAKHLIVEFGDYQCAYCKAGNDAIKQLLGERPLEVRYVWKNDPSPLHTNSDTAAEASMCAAKQGKFWDYHDRLFGDQQGFDQISLIAAADAAGLDDTAFGTCLSGHEAKPLVERTLTEGQALGIQALPTYFIDGKRYEGQMTYEDLVQAISP